MTGRSKRFSSLALLLCGILVPVGCGGEEGDPSSSRSSATESTSGSGSDSPGASTCMKVCGAIPSPLMGAGGTAASSGAAADDSNCSLYCTYSTDCVLQCAFSFTDPAVTTSDVACKWICPSPKPGPACCKVCDATCVASSTTKLPPESCCKTVCDSSCPATSSGTSTSSGASDSKS
jgi:hypothetical protein